MFVPITPETVAIALVAVLSVARTVRLLVHDEFPPVEWLRLRFLVLVGPDNSWAKLIKCQFCLAPYLVAGMGGWLWLAWTPSGPHWTWWVANGWWALSYVAAMVVSYDQPVEPVEIDSD